VSTPHRCWCPRFNRVYFRRIFIGETQFVQVWEQSENYHHSNCRCSRLKIYQGGLERAWWRWGSMHSSISIWALYFTIPNSSRSTLSLTWHLRARTVKKNYNWMTITYSSPPRTSLTPNCTWIIFKIKMTSLLSKLKRWLT